MSEGPTEGEVEGELEGDLSRLDEVADRVRLAGFGLAAPLLALREGQLEREVARVTARRGTDHPEVAARQAALTRTRARVRVFREEAGRAHLDRPQPGDGDDAAVWGRVTRDGAPAPDLVVSAVTPQGRADFDCTGADGGFTLTVPPEVPVRLSVRSPEGAELHRDPEGRALGPGQQQFREIDLVRGARPPCPEPPEEPDEEPDTFPLVDLVGQREASAVSLLQAAGLRLGRRSERPADGQEGVVVEQDPPAGTPVRHRDEVALVVGAPSAVPVPSLLGLTLPEARAVLGKADLTLGEVTHAQGAGRPGLVVDQDPAPETQVQRGAAVALVVAAQGRDDPREPHDRFDRVVGRAEELLVKQNARQPEGGLRARLEQIVGHDTDGLRELLAADPKQVADRLGLGVRDARVVLKALDQALAEVQG